VLITQFKEASIGLQLATELGTIALLANIFREMMALLGAPLLTSDGAEKSCSSVPYWNQY